MTIQNTAFDSTATHEQDKKAIEADGEHGVLSSWWQLAIGLAEASSTFGFGIAQDTRQELRRRFDVTLTFAEEMGVGGFSFVRGIGHRVDRLAHQVLGRGEASVLVVTRTLRKTGHGVADLASAAATDTIGAPSRSAAAARTAA